MILCRATAPYKGTSLNIPMLAASGALPLTAPLALWICRCLFPADNASGVESTRVGFGLYDACTSPSSTPEIVSSLLLTTMNSFLKTSLWSNETCNCSSNVYERRSSTYDTTLAANTVKQLNVPTIMLSFSDTISRTTGNFIVKTNEVISFTSPIVFPVSGERDTAFYQHSPTQPPLTRLGIA